MVVRSSGRVVPHAAVRGQCARHKYYGDAEIERRLGELEGRHASAFKAARDHAWADGPSLTVMQRYWLRQALVLQHSRTPRRVMLRASSTSQLAMHAFREHLAAQPHTAENRRMLRALDTGEVVLQPPEAFEARLGIQVALEGVPLTMDLGLHLLRNRTDRPFLLGDSPCVSSNHYKREITGIGVAGLASRGLMIAMPLDTRTSLMMLDTAVYHPSLPPIVDVENVEDVEELNLLQVLEAVDCVYFARTQDAEYAREFVVAHPKLANDGVGGFGVIPGAETGGVHPLGDLMHVYEPPAPATLDLSFIRTDDLRDSENLAEPRCGELCEQYSAGGQGAEVGAYMPINELVEWVKPRLTVRKKP